MTLFVHIYSSLEACRPPPDKHMQVSTQTHRQTRIYTKWTRLFQYISYDHETSLSCLVLRKGSSIMVRLPSVFQAGGQCCHCQPQHQRVSEGNPYLFQRQVLLKAMQMPHSESFQS